jgi:hypothetical protein
VDSAIKLILKSLLTGILGTCIFFSFLMPISVAVLAAISRLTVETGNTTSVVVDPNHFLQHVGLPLSGLVFLACFAAAVWHFHQLAIREPSRSH